MDTLPTQAKPNLHQELALAQRSEYVFHQASAKKTIKLCLQNDQPPTQTLQLLKALKIPAWNKLSEEELKMIANVFSTVRVARQETIITEGEHGTFFGILLRGSLVASQANSEEKQSIHQGSWFGEMGYFSAGKRSCTVTSVDEALISVLRYAELNQISQYQPPCYRAIMTGLAQSILAKFSKEPTNKIHFQTDFTPSTCPSLDNAAYHKPKNSDLESFLVKTRKRAASSAACRSVVCEEDAETLKLEADRIHAQHIVVSLGHKLELASSLVITQDKEINTMKHTITALEKQNHVAKAEYQKLKVKLQDLGKHIDELEHEKEDMVHLIDEKDYLIHEKEGELELEEKALHLKKKETELAERHMIYIKVQGWVTSFARKWLYKTRISKIRKQMTVIHQQKSMFERLKHQEREEDLKGKLATMTNLTDAYRAEIDDYKKQIAVLSGCVNTAKAKIIRWAVECFQAASFKKRYKLVLKYLVIKTVLNNYRAANILKQCFEQAVLSSTALLKERAWSTPLRNQSCQDDTTNLDRRYGNLTTKFPWGPIGAHQHGMLKDKFAAVSSEIHLVANLCEDVLGNMTVLRDTVGCLTQSNLATAAQDLDRHGRLLEAEKTATKWKRENEKLLAEVASLKARLETAGENTQHSDVAIREERGKRIGLPKSKQQLEESITARRKVQKLQAEIATLENRRQVVEAATADHIEAAEAEVLQLMRHRALLWNSAIELRDLMTNGNVKVPVNTQEKFRERLRCLDQQHATNYNPSSKHHSLQIEWLRGHMPQERKKYLMKSPKTTRLWSKSTGGLAESDQDHVHQNKVNSQDVLFHSRTQRKPHFTPVLASSQSMPPLSRPPQFHDLSQ